MSITGILFVIRTSQETLQRWHHSSNWLSLYIAMDESRVVDGVAAAFLSKAELYTIVLKKDVHEVDVGDGNHLLRLSVIKKPLSFKRNSLTHPLPYDLSSQDDSRLPLGRIIS